MPYIEMRDPFGMCYRITTIGEELLQPWFDFWLPKLFPPDLPPDYGNPVLTAWPCPIPGSREMDWPGWSPLISEPFQIPREPARALDALRERRKWIEEEAARKGWT